jgi:metal-sulfur cluster biosynthetic enzyme
MNTIRVEGGTPRYNRITDQKFDSQSSPRTMTHKTIQSNVITPDRDAILESLGNILDPCSVSAGRPMDIVQMGLIGELRIVGASVHLTLVLTEPACWFSKDLMDFAKNRIEMTQGVQEAVVVLDTEIVWTPDRIKSPRPFLGRYPVKSIAA